MSKLYNCSICKTPIEWEDNDDIKGAIWECEVCDKYFCTDCFSKALSRKIFDKMVREDDTIKCPHCYQEAKENEYLDEACRQWCDFIAESTERRTGIGFAQFYREIKEQMLKGAVDSESEE